MSATQSPTVAPDFRPPPRPIVAKVKFDNCEVFQVSKHGQCYLVPLTDESMEIVVGDYVMLNGQTREVTRILHATGLGAHAEATPRLAFETPGFYPSKLNVSAGHYVKAMSGEYLKLEEM